MQKWEYKVEKFASGLYANDSVQDILNEHGKNGWELVNIIPQYSSSSNKSDQLEDVYIEINAFVFKRPKD